MARMVDFAEFYASRFGAVVPVGQWEFTSKTGEIVSMWKKPLLKNWAEAPLPDVMAVRRCWNYYASRYRETPGIAIATGQICGGYIVIDLDRKPDRGIDGYEELKTWQRETGKTLPDTWTGLSGGGGVHLWYHTDRALRSYANDSIGVDLRADGACIVVAPSLHESGRRYAWEVSPNDMECAEATDAVFDFIEHFRPSGSQFHGSTKRGQGGERFLKFPEVVPNGGRHTVLIALIGSLNGFGISDEGIIKLIRHENQTRLQPPLSEEELQREIFPAVFRFEKGIPMEWVTDDKKAGDPGNG